MYYCEITDFTKAVPGVVIVHYNVCRTADGSVVVPNATKAFHGVRDEETGRRVVVDTLEKADREDAFKNDIDAYFAEVIAGMEAADQDYADLKDTFIGYRYPPASGGVGRAKA